MSCSHCTALHQPRAAVRWVPLEASMLHAGCGSSLVTVRKHPSWSQRAHAAALHCTEQPLQCTLCRLAQPTATYSTTAVQLSSVCSNTLHGSRLGPWRFAVQDPGLWYSSTWHGPAVQALLYCRGGTDGVRKGAVAMGTFQAIALRYSAAHSGHLALNAPTLLIPAVHARPSSCPTRPPSTTCRWSSWRTSLSVQRTPTSRAASTGYRLSLASSSL